MRDPEIIINRMINQVQESLENALNQAREMGPKAIIAENGKVIGFTKLNILCPLSRALSRVKKLRGHVEQLMKSVKKHGIRN